MLNKYRFKNVNKSLIDLLINGNFLRVGQNKCILNDLLKPPYSNQKYLKKIQDNKTLVGIDEYSNRSIIMTNTINDKTSYQGYITSHWIYQFIIDTPPEKSVIPTNRGIVAFRNPIKQSKFDLLLSWNINNNIFVVDLTKIKDDYSSCELLSSRQIFKVKTVYDTNLKYYTCYLPIADIDYVTSNNNFIDSIPNLLSNCFKYIFKNIKRRGHFRKSKSGKMNYISPVYKTSNFTNLLHIIHTNYNPTIDT